jgi:hypothetical protein
MRHAIFLISSLLLSVWAHAQGTTPPVFETNNAWSFSVGYGTQGYALQGDYGIVDIPVKARFNVASLRVLAEIGFKPITFSQTTYTFDYVQYPSDARLTTFTLAGGFEFRKEHWSLYPYLGFRYFYVRFTDPDLVDAIGATGIRRYNTDDYGTRYQVGPVVPNAYGDAFALDLGGMAGYHFTRTFEVSGLVGLSPASFSTASTLYGRYRGEAPYFNPFYVKPFPVRGELKLRFNFNM